MDDPVAAAAAAHAQNAPPPEDFDPDPGGSSLDDVAAGFDALDGVSDDAQPPTDAVQQPRDPNGRFARGDDTPADDDQQPRDAQEADQDGKPDADDATDTGEAEDEFYDSLDELAEAWEGVEVDDLMALKVKFKAAGEDHSATLQELVKGNQLQRDYTKGQQALARERQEFDAARRQNLDALQQTADALKGYFDNVRQQYTAALDSDDMKAMLEDDPAEYMRTHTQLKQQLDAFDAYAREHGQRYDAFRAWQQEQFLEEEGRKLYSDPTWNDERTQRAIEGIHSLGFTPQEATNMIDARIIRAADELVTLRARVQELETAKDRGQQAATRVKRRVPPLMKPTARRRAAAGSGNQQLDKAAQRFNQTGSVDDLAAVFAGMEN